MMRVLRDMRMGLGGLLANPFRSVLTTLGIVIGVLAVVLITSIANGV